MNIKISPTQDIKVLKETLDSRFKKAVVSENSIELEIKEEKLGQLERTPGVDYFKKEDQKVEGLGGKPVKKKAYARLESEKDAVKAFLATLKGYSLVIFDTDREWDLRNLRRYNPDIIQLKNSEPVESLEINYCVGKVEGCKEVEINIEEEKVSEIYSKMLT